MDWATSFWQLCAARQIERPAALAALAAAGGSMEDAATAFYSQPLTAPATAEELPAF